MDLELCRLWDATTAAEDEPDDKPDAADRGRAKTKGTASGRFATLNGFVDFTAGTLTRAELLVWLTLFRDTKPADGLARTSQADLARRARVNIRTAKRAVLSLCRRGLLTVVFRGSLRRGPSIYRALAMDRSTKSAEGSNH